MDDTPSVFPTRIGYPPHNLYEFNGQFPQPANNALYGPFPPQHPVASPAAPMTPRNSTSQTPHGAMSTPAAALKRSLADANRPVRKRITRACDQCNQLRTKCDGQQPCTHCTKLGIECQYNREQKKRGKASRKELAKRVIYKDSAGSGAGSDKATDTATKRKANKPEAVSIRMSCQAPLRPPAAMPAAPATPRESIPGTSARTNGGETRSSYLEHMLASGMYGNEFVPVYDGLLPNRSSNSSSNFTGSDQSFSAYAGRFSQRHGSSSEAISNGHHQVAHAVQPESAPFQEVGKFGEEPVSMEGVASNWQNVIPSSQGPSSFAAATFGQTSFSHFDM